MAGEYRTARLTNFASPIRDFMDSWLRRPTAGLFIFGPVGTGKTFLAAALLRWLLEAQKDVVFCRAAQFFADLQESYRVNTSTDAIVENLERPKFLIVDDVGSGALSDHERRFTLELIERRINRNRPTILTTNWSREEIGEKMDARISSRLALFTELKLAGDDLREIHGDMPIDAAYGEPLEKASEAEYSPVSEEERETALEFSKALKVQLHIQAGEAKPAAREPERKCYSPPPPARSLDEQKAELRCRGFLP